MPNTTVTFTAPSSGASGTFANGSPITTATTNSNGLATASAFTANSTAGAYTVIASALGLNTHFTLTNNAAAGSIVPAAGSGQSATVSSAFPTALQATVKDPSGNPLPNKTVTFTAPSGTLFPLRRISTGLV